MNLEASRWFLPGMATNFLSLVGQLVKSINPSLLPYPPPSIEQSGSDVCYLGLNGEQAQEHLVYCKDLPYGKRGIVGSWYLSPERHVIEYSAFVVLSAIIILVLTPHLSRYPQEKADRLTPPKSIKIITFFTFTSQLIYKLYGYSGKIVFMAMPCNVLWILWTMICFFPNIPLQARHVIHQLIVPYSSLAVIAVVTPDLSDLVMWMEIPFFFFMHIALIVYPIYLMKLGFLSVLPLPGSSDTTVSNFFKWWVLACTYFSLFYFGVGVPLSLVSGINLNYMLHPPPMPGSILLGPNYRLQSTLVCAALFFFYRFVLTIVEIFGLTTEGRSVIKSKRM